jgi:PAS domain S-box-containing protein
MAGEIGRKPTPKDNGRLPEGRRMLVPESFAQRAGMENGRVEEALRESERKLSLIINTIPAMAWSSRPDGSAEFFNQHYLEYVGLSADQAEYWDFTVAIHPDDVTGLSRTWQAIMASGAPGEAEARIRRFDGEYRWFLFRTNPLHDETGTIVRWYGVNTDIEDRKRAETDLAREKQVMEMIASGGSLRDVLTWLCKLIEEAAPDCYCDVHPIDWRGPTFRFGVAPSLPASYTAPVAGLPVSPELLPCGIAAHENRQVIAEDMESDPRWQASYVRTHALEYGVRAVWSTPICSKGGNVLGTFCIYQQKPGTPSARHQSLIAHATHIASIAIDKALAEEALAVSERNLQLTIDTIPALAWSALPDGSADFFSRHYLHFVGLSAAEAKGWGWAAALHPDDSAGLAATWQSILASGKAGEAEARLRRHDGEYRWLLFRANPLRNEEGEIVKWYGVNTDIEDRKRAEEALNKTRSELAHVARVTALSTLTASIAHEVNQPIAGIVTNAGTSVRMLSADPPNIEGALETARRTIRDANRASEVVSRLRALFSKNTVTTEDVNLNEAAREVVALSLGELRRNRVSVHTQLEADLPPVAGDRIQLQQVILNLLLNASDAIGAANDGPRQVSIETGRDEAGNVRLSVRDTGVGIAPEAAPRLFDAFYTTKAAGMGIGLSVSRSIVERHGGGIWAETNQGSGATFSFSIPRRSGVSVDDHGSATGTSRPSTGNDGA